MITKRYNKWLLSLSFVFSALVMTSCVDNDDDVPESRYSTEKLTAAQFLQQNKDRLSSFITVLKRSSYFSMLSTYGNYTVFAPNNEAMDKFMRNNSYNSVDEIPLPVCDTLARTHIIKTQAFFTTDISEGSLGMNMAETYITLSITSDTISNAVIHYANKIARMVEFDDSVTNGVVHIVNNTIPRSSDKLPDIIANDSTITLFTQALFLTGLADSLMAYEDKTYPPVSPDSLDPTMHKKVCKSGSDGGVAVETKWPEHRYFKFTAFVETDEIYKQHGINNIKDLIAHAKEVYDAVFPQDAGKYDDSLTHRKNPLNRFISYHIIDRRLTYDGVIMSKGIMGAWDTDKCDPEEFYETMCPGTLMRFSYPNEQLYINRKGVKKNASIKGVRVLKDSESGLNLQDVPNGVYYYIDDILEFSKEVQDDVLNCRLRFDATVLSPDFENSGARGRYGKKEDNLDAIVYGFRDNFIKNFKVMGEDAFVGLHNDDIWWSSFKGNAVTINGIFDITIKLPPVPKSGTYELRTGYTVGVERGVVQFYLNDKPCGIPADLRMFGGDPRIGFVNDDTDDTPEAKNYNKGIDKAMRNHGYMKAMDCYWQGADKANVLRSHVHNLRYIMATQYFDQNETYYLRARQVLKDRTCYWSFDYLELCPKSVYGSSQGEDQH
jgi:uncharacterized surface protein with fasciclin (FAS1) repeats